MFSPAAPSEMFQRPLQFHPIAPRTAPLCTHPSALPFIGNPRCILADWAAQRACQLLFSLTNLPQSCLEASSSAVKFLAAMRMSWTHPASGGAMALFPSHPQQIPTPSISTARQTPACRWLTARPTSLLRKTLNQSAVQTRVRGHTQAARKRGGSKCSSLSSQRITWTTTGVLTERFYSAVCNNGLAVAAFIRVTIILRFATITVK